MTAVVAGIEQTILLFLCLLYLFRDWRDKRKNSIVEERKSLLDDQGEDNSSPFSTEETKPLAFENGHSVHHNGKIALSSERMPANAKTNYGSYGKDDNKIAIVSEYDIGDSDEYNGHHTPLHSNINGATTGPHLRGSGDGYLTQGKEFQEFMKRPSSLVSLDTLEMENPDMWQEQEKEHKRYH